PKDVSASGDPSAGATRLLREAQSMARLNHPNVVSIYDVGSIPAGVYIAMEHIDGVTLTTWLGETPRSWREVLRVFEAAGRGIEAAHRAGLIHRDFKPDNVMIGVDGRVRVLDFGLARPAKVIDHDSSERMDSSGGWSPASHLELKLTMPGTVMGTPRYMAPEQHLGQATDERSDIYSFCVALWEAVYGTRPFSGHSLAEIATKVVSGEVDEPPKSARVPRWLRAVLRRGMARDPTARFPDMSALLAALGHDRLRRTRWIAAGGALAIAIAIGAFASHRLANAALCDDSDSVLFGVWDDDRKHAIERAFEQEGKKYTAASWRNVERTLDEYSAGLVAMRKEACEASRVYGTQSDEVLGRRMACLDRRLQRLAALTGALSEGGTTTVLRAVEAAHGLPDLDLCADVERLASGVPPPDDPAVRARVDELRLELERIHSLGVANKLDGVLERLDAVIADARATEYRPLVAEALLLRGNFFANLSRTDDARASLLEGLDEAEATGHDPVIAEISIVMIFVEGSARNQFEVADTYSRRAAAVIERMGGDPRLQVYLWTKEGVLQNVRDLHDEAAVTLQRALDLSREIEATGPQILPILNPLASALIGAGRLEEAEAVIQESQAIVDADVGPDHPNAGALFATMAHLRSKQNRNEESLALHERARDVIIAALGADHPNVGAVANGMGLALSSLGRDDEALRAYEDALAVMERTSGPNHLSVATALQNMAYIEVRTGRGREALAHMTRVLAIREAKFGSEHSGVALAKDLLGDAHALLGHPDEARRFYREAIATFQALESPEQEAYGHVGLAKLLLAEGNAEPAAAEVERALALHGKDTSDGDRGEARFVLAKALYAIGRDRSRARDLLRQAEDDLRKAGLSRARELDEVLGWAKAHP
ncbi:MAG TPA: serine/threonine-protein kinase, partial [Nannocystaceae bacterium]|nr:serine/threonine-protein kinase [Nannocystaceae bacterium]